MEVCFESDPPGGLCSCMGPPPDSLPPPPNFTIEENDRIKVLWWKPFTGALGFVALCLVITLVMWRRKNGQITTPDGDSTNNGDGQVDKASEPGKGKDSPADNNSTKQAWTPDPGNQLDERDNPTLETGVNETSNTDGKEETTTTLMTLPSEQ